MKWLQRLRRKVFWHIRKLHKGKTELSAAPGAGERVSSLSQLILCKKQRTALGQRLILRFHPHIEILQTVIILTLGLRKIFFFFKSCKDLDHWWSSLWGLLYLRQGYCSSLASGRVTGHGEKSWLRSQQCFKLWVPVTFRNLLWAGQMP